MPPHERNPICIKDSEHLAELIKLRFDTSDAKQEVFAKSNEEKLEVITKQVLATNGRTRKLEDAHIEQIIVNREMLEAIVLHKKQSAAMALALEAVKDSVGDIARRPSATIFIQKNWVATITIILSIIAIFVSINSINSSKDEGTTKHQQPNTSNSVENNRHLDGYSSGSGELGRPNTVFRVH